jgi:hypothetical protein
MTMSGQKRQVLQYNKLPHEETGMVLDSGTGAATVLVGRLRLSLVLRFVQALFKH